MAHSQPFKFKQFHVHHSQCAHKVGTDGVLLGAWASHPKPKRILDVGSGSGLVSFMLAQRHPTATFVGLDVHAPSVNQAKQSLSEGPFADRGTFIQANFLAWDTNGKFDLIVSNPPFFEKAQNTQQPQRDAARQQQSLNHHAMLENMAALLSPQGKIALILPTQEAHHLSQYASNYNLFLNELTLVSSFEGSKIIRHLMSFGKKQQPIAQGKLALKNELGQRSTAYQKLTASFYL